MDMEAEELKFKISEKRIAWHYTQSRYYTFFIVFSARATNILYNDT